MNSIILKGTNVPDWCVIGASALLKGSYNLSPYTILAGIPAKPLKSGIKRKDLELISKNSEFRITRRLNVFG